MNTVYVSIETNIEGFEFYKKLWGNRGIIGIRAETMQEGIEAVIAIKKSKTECLYFVDIVADDIDFMPLLTVLSSAINVPVLIATSNYDEDEHHEAINKGAFFYGRYCNDPEKNITGVRVEINNYHRARKEKESTEIITCGNMLILSEYKMVFCDNTEIVFTSKEYCILLMLLEKRNLTIPIQKIAEKVWVNEAATDETVRKNIDRLRYKLSNSNFHGAEIINYRNMGYRFQTQLDS